MKNIQFFKIRLLPVVLITISILGIESCNNYQNPGNNTGKTGDGTGTDSLKAKKNDTGKGSNRLNKLIIKKGDSIN
jgi:hypothetical protein